MRLKKLSLAPFAGFLKKELELQPGLNVILGANDVGKSTVFRAIDAALFLGSKVSKSTKEGKDLPRILPYGSDHARATLELENAGASYLIEKSWGSGHSVTFSGPGGSRVSTDDKVDEALRALLPVPPATFQNVLFMGQGSLEGTVAALDEKREALHSLGDLLRLAVDKNAGVSVDRLKHSLSAKIEKAFSYWDRKAGLPEKGRGIENKWLKNVGSILAAFYAREEARRAARDAEALESERDRKLLTLSELQARREGARVFVAANKSIVEAASQRQTLDAKISKARMESDSIVHDLNAWMQAESDRRNFSPEVERLERKRGELEEELKGALAFSKRKDVLQRFEKAKAAKAKLAEAKGAIAALAVLRPEDLKRVRAAQLEVDAIRTSLKAGKIQLQFSVKRELDISFKKDLDSDQMGRMVPGKPLKLTAGGRIQLFSEYFDLAISTGEGKFVELEESLGKKSEALSKLLADLKVTSLEDAQEKHDRFLEASNAIRSLEAVLVSALASGEKFEDLERLASAAGAAASGREPELVQAEFQSVAKEFASKKEGLVKAESLVKELVRRHGVENTSLLLERMAEKKQHLKSLEAQLAALPPLPEGLLSLEAFLEKYRAMSALSESVGEQVRALQLELAELKIRMPAESAQDLSRVLLEASAAFDFELAHGNALLRVDEAIRSVEGQAGDVYASFQEEFLRLVNSLSAGKYSKAAMQESLPTNFHRQDGAQIPWAWLSAGTKDAFALALRLAMAKYFLGQSSGFLMIDDPLVNMDPERQKIAAAMLKEFGASKQVLLFTCHPAHAELLGGNLIRI